MKTVAKIIVGSAIAVGGVYAAIPGKPEADTVGVTAAAVEMAEPVAVEPAPEVAPEPLTDAPGWLSYPDAYERCTETGEPLVVVLGAEGCLHCMETKNDIDEARESGVVYCYIDVEADEENAKKFGYSPQAPYVPITLVYYQTEAGWSQPARYLGRKAKAVVCGTIRAARKLNTATRSVLRKGVKGAAKVAVLPVKAVAHVVRERPVATYFQERAPVRTFFANGGFFRR